MPKHNPFVVDPSDEERWELGQRSLNTPYRDVIRVKIVLPGATGLRNGIIASHFDIPRQIVSKWRKRFCQETAARRAVGFAVVAIPAR